MSRTRPLDQEAGPAMSALGAAAGKGLGDPALAGPVMIRASRLDHRAFCLDTRLRLARRSGEPEGRGRLPDGWNRLMVSRRIPPGGHQP